MSAHPSLVPAVHHAGPEYLDRKQSREGHSFFAFDPHVVFRHATRRIALTIGIVVLARAIHMKGPTKPERVRLAHG